LDCLWVGLIVPNLVAGFFVTGIAAPALPTANPASSKQQRSSISGPGMYF